MAIIRLFLLIVLLASAGCGSGEPLVKDERRGRSRSPLPEPSVGSSSAAWSNSGEYKASNGLRTIRAAEGYAVRTTGRPGGAGKTVAVLDTPVDLSHDDLDGTTYNFLLDNPNPNFRDPNIAHGTHVSGTIAARRDGRGVHGVAYNAGLVGIGVLRAVPRQRLFVSPIADSPSDIAAGIASAAGLKREYFVYDASGRRVPVTDFFGSSKLSNPGAKADVINMSLGSPDPQGIIQSAMRDAAWGGRIMVATLGDCGQPLTNPQCSQLRDSDGIGPTSAPAAYVGRSPIAGFGIAVGALDETGSKKANFSNACGEVAKYCLFAPGSGILSTVTGNRFQRMSGTSMAAAHVAGAAAVVWGAFPKKSGDEIVTRLFETARPVDRRALSPVFGHGALDLGAALRPVGSMGLPVAEARTVPLKDSFVLLPPGFNSPYGTSNVIDAVVYDEQAFPFRYNLNTLFRVSRTRSADSFAQWFLSSLGRPTTILPMEPATAQLTEVATEEAIVLITDGISGRTEDDQDDIHLRFHASPELTIALAKMSDPLGASTGFVTERTALFRGGLSPGPFTALAGRGIGVDANWRWDEDTTVDIVGINGTGYSGSMNTQLASFGLIRRIGDRMILGLRYGTLREDGSRFGIVAKGAFGGSPIATTHFVDLSAAAWVLNDAVLFGGMSYATTNGASLGAGALVSDWSSMRADSFSIGAQIRHLWVESDHLIMTASLPFRVHDARITINVPDQEIADGIVGYTPETIQLAPRGREGRLQVMYGIGIRDDVTAAVGGFARMEPNHDPSADPEFGAALTVNISF